MSWQTNGNVGIGVNNPSTKLHVVNTGTVTWTGEFHNATADSYGVGISVGDGNGTKSLFEVQNSAESVTYFKVRADGNVGIGVNNPAQKLEVNTVGDNTDCYIKLDADPDNDAGIKFGDNGEEFFQINHYGGSAGNEKFYIVDGSTNGIVLLQGGSVGIGTADPDEKLEVNGSIHATSPMYTSKVTGITVGNSATVTLTTPVGAGFWYMHLTSSYGSNKLYASGTWARHGSSSGAGVVYAMDWANDMSSHVTPTISGGNIVLTNAHGSRNITDGTIYYINVLGS